MSFAANVSTDIYLIAIPLPMLWGSSLKMIKKIASTFILGAGIFVLVCAIMKSVFVLVVSLHAVPPLQPHSPLKQGPCTWSTACRSMGHARNFCCRHHDQPSSSVPSFQDMAHPLFRKCPTVVTEDVPNTIRLPYHRWWWRRRPKPKPKPSWPSNCKPHLGQSFLQR